MEVYSARREEKRENEAREKTRSDRAADFDSPSSEGRILKIQLTKEVLRSGVEYSSNREAVTGVDLEEWRSEGIRGEIDVLDPRGERRELALKT